VGKAAEIHHRMPVIISHEDIDNWLCGSFEPAKMLTDVNIREADMPAGQIKFDM
jgi:putative SOS response-associated peptidase YedK